VRNIVPQQNPNDIESLGLENYRLSQTVAEQAELIDSLRERLSITQRQLEAITELLGKVSEIL